MRKKYYFLLCIVFFIAIVFITQVVEVRAIVYSLIAYYLGVSAVYDYFKKEPIRFGWMVVENEDNMTERLISLFVAILFVVLSVAALVQGWNN